MVGTHLFKVSIALGSVFASGVVFSDSPCFVSKTKNKEQKKH